METSDLIALIIERINIDTIHLTCYDLMRSKKKEERKTMLAIEIQTEITSREETTIMNRHASSNR